jgi:hypothetical protein
LDFIISGCVFYGPTGSDDNYVTGLFDSADAPFQHFFPPTSISHRRDVTARIGAWQDPRMLRLPLDNEFLLRAAHAGMRFASTCEVTAHKFAAGNRYLSYLRVTSDEQRQFLRSLSGPPGIDLDAIVHEAKINGQYMIFTYGDYSSHPEGFLFERNRESKGINRPALRPLLDCVRIEQTDEPRASDWYRVESDGKRHRWSGPNPRPKILIPYTGQRARISVEVMRKNPHVPVEELSLYVEERPARCQIETDSAGSWHLVANIALQPDDYTVLTVNAPTFRPIDIGVGEDRRKIGIAVSDIIIEPI